MKEELKKNYYTKRLALLIVISCMIRIILASFTELGNDEVYYWTYSQHLQWNYFDHPPMVALWIRIFTANLLLEKYELFVRLGSIVSCAISTLIIFIIGKKLHSEKAGWLMACLYNTSLYASILAGVFILPDSPQMLFWCFCLLLLTNLSINCKSWRTWLLFGLCAGLCILSKVHGVFIWIGLFSFIIFKKRQWLKLPQLYCAFLISAGIASPILFWNIANHFATYQFHSERVTINKFYINYKSFCTEFFGEILYNNPINIVAIVAALFWFKRKKINNQALTLFSFIALPFIILLLSIALFRDTLPHWSGPAYVTLIPVAGIYFAQNNITKLPSSIKVAFAFILFVAIGGILVINYYPGTVGDKTEGKTGDGDFTLDMNGWKEAGQQFQKIYYSDVKNKIMPHNANMICYKWFPAAHEQYYFCYPISMNVIGLGKPFDLHEYLWYNSFLKNNTSLNISYCIIPSNESYDPKQVYKSDYSNIHLECEINTFRNNKLARVFYVYQLSGWKGKIPYP